MPQLSHVWTPEEVRALPEDGRRYEVVAGELLVTPAPSFQHQEAVLRLAIMLRDYSVARRLPLGRELLPDPHPLRQLRDPLPPQMPLRLQDPRHEASLDMAALRARGKGRPLGRLTGAPC